VLILINPYHEPVSFALPELRGNKWIPHIDTRTANGLPHHAGEARSEPYLVTGRSMAVLTQTSA